MQINRQSYEEFFLLYTDGELGLDERRAVEDFIKENPDLEHELILMQQTIAVPDESIVFEDKELLYRKEERKVIPWFRLSAAAVLLIAFSILGWLYLDHQQTVRNGEIASTEKVAVQPALKKTEPPAIESTVADEPAAPSETITKKANVVDLYNKSSLASAKSGKTKSEQTEQVVKPAITVPAPDPAQIEHDVVKTDPLPVEDVNVPVVAREIKPETETVAAEEEPNNNAGNVQYVNGDDNDMIYFANTSLPKKTKLRGVLRKATRILDKVTSFQ